MAGLREYDDGTFSGYYDENGDVIICHEKCTDEECGAYLDLVLNCSGYYDVSGRFKFFDFEGCAYGIY